MSPPPTTFTGGKIGLIDYGQSKQLPDAYRAAFAQLVRCPLCGASPQGAGRGGRRPALVAIPRKGG